MVVEANRDACRECVQRAGEAIEAGDESKARRLLLKAQKLDPSFDAEGYLRSKGITVNKDEPHQGNNYDHNDHYENAEGLRSRRKNFESSRSADSTASKNSTTSRNHEAEAEKRQRSRSRSKPAAQTASAEEVAHVERIRHCKDYYEVLQVSHDVSEAQLKKRYRELALKLHPDKCNAPGATEAFKALGNAYSVLSDSSKREQYDASGRDSQFMSPRTRNRGFYDYDVNRGFESEVTPEEIFEMFFGGGFTTGHVYRRRTHYQRQEVPEERSTLATILQILPLLVLLFGAMIMQLLAGEPAFSLRSENGYNVQRFTKDLRVPYYVKSDFMQRYGDRLYSVEVQVEEEYVNRVRLNCYREKNSRETALWRAKMAGDQQLWAHAQKMEMPNCKRLEELYH